MDNALVRLTQAGVSFNDQAALSDVNLVIEPSQIAALIDPNNTGKTILVYNVLGLLKSHVGEVWRWSRPIIGYMPQKLHADITLPLNVLYLPRLVPGVRREQAPAASREIGAARVLERPLQSISGGELRRVLLARILLHEPELLVPGEPMQGADVASQTKLYHLVGKLRGRYGCGTLMVSRDLHLVMSAINQVVCLDRHVCCSGYPEQVNGDPAFVELFNQDARSLVIYYRHHNHAHDLCGGAVKAGPDALPPGTRFTPVYKRGPDCNRG